MKKIPKKRLNAVIGMTREYWETGETSIIRKRINRAQAMEDTTGLSWSAILNLLDGILGPHGFCPDATEDEIYCALRCLGWEVVDDGEKQTSESL